MARSIDTRLDRLASDLRDPPKGCGHCRDWPDLRVIIGNDPLSTPCPHCGREASDGVHLVRLGQRRDGPQ
jgi:hypothetical protein